MCLCLQPSFSSLCQTQVSSENYLLCIRNCIKICFLLRWSLGFTFVFRRESSYMWFQTWHHTRNKEWGEESRESMYLVDSLLGKHQLKVWIRNSAAILGSLDLLELPLGRFQLDWQLYGYLYKFEKIKMEALTQVPTLKAFRWVPPVHIKHTLWSTQSARLWSWKYTIN